ncbi:MAG TPA: HD domain-containing protein, partial [Bacteroidetes bacterium]|nr:HD domain-containing protein [Bacteroidota bacterium]
VLYWAAVLHDIGKTRMTRFQDGRWRSPGHEKAGVPMAMDYLLRKPELSLEVREKVLGIVRWHGFPLHWIRHKRPLADLKRLGTWTDLRLLSIFAVFDFYGRICEDQVPLLKKIDHFQEVDTPRAEYEFGTFAALQERFSKWNLRHKNAVWNAFRLKDTVLLEKLIQADEAKTPPSFGKKVFLTLGPAASGKTAFLAENYPDLFRIDLAEHGLAESDLGNAFYESRKLVEFRHFLTVYLNRHRQVALDGRNLNEDFRRRLTGMVRDLNVEIEILVFRAPLESLLARDAHAEGVSKPDFIREMYAAQDLIHPWEAHQVTFVNTPN